MLFPLAFKGWSSVRPEWPKRQELLVNLMRVTTVGGAVKSGNSPAGRQYWVNEALQEFFVTEGKNACLLMSKVVSRPMVICE